MGVVVGDDKLELSQSFILVTCSLLGEAAS